MAVNRYEWGLAVRHDGRPTKPVRTVALDELHTADPATVKRLQDELASSPSVAIGLAARQPSESLLPLLDTLTMTIAGPGVRTYQTQMIGVEDPQAACATLVSAVERAPQCSVALAQLLRQTPYLETLPALAAEAAVYSMLLGGTEFTDWLASRGACPPTPETGLPSVQMHRDGHRLLIELDRPRRRNALSFEMREELFEALELAELDDTVELVELSGAGGGFCSGGDLAEFGTATDLVSAYLVRLDRAPWRLIDRLRDRVMVRVHGAAVGAGTEMAAFAGRVVAYPDAFFCLPEIEMGLVPGAGGTVSVPRRIGRWRAAWMMLSGSWIDAVTALGWGLVDEIAER